MNCQRRRSGPSFEVDAALTPVRNGPGRPRGEPGADRREPGTSRGGDCGAFRRRAPDECFRQRETIRTIRSPATARRAVVIGLQPAANGRGCGLCV